MTTVPRAGGPRTIFLGSGAFGVASLERLYASPEVDLVGVVTAPARPAGRKAVMTGTPIATAAGQLGIATILTPERLRSPEAIETILDLDPELIVLADYGRLVPARLLHLPFGALNLHPSLLPRHRGATPIPATILAGDTVTGVTLMRMDEGLDTGPIVVQTRVGLSGTETAPALEVRLALEAAVLLERSLGPWIRAEITALPQPGEGATLTKPLRRAHGRLHPEAAATNLERQVRAYQPWPGSYLETDAGRLTVWRATVGPAATGTAPGTFGPGPELRLATNDRWLILDDVQPAGGRRMPGPAWLIGRPAIAGSTIHANPD